MEELKQLLKRTGLNEKEVNHVRKGIGEVAYLAAEKGRSLLLSQCASRICNPPMFPMTCSGARTLGRMFKGPQDGSTACTADGNPASTVTPPQHI